MMFWRFLKTKTKEHSPFLFFNRNRASIDYQMSQTANLPQFGLTAAFSYNRRKLKSLGLVVAGQILNRGVFPKAGLQYVFLQKDVVIFTWLVCETLRKPSIDYFFLGRYSPFIGKGLNLFFQLELLKTIPITADNLYVFTQRVRAGLMYGSVQFGPGADFTETGKNSFIFTPNTGAFLRYVF